jgi:iron complex transport system substrate-binding protein
MRLALVAFILALAGCSGPPAPVAFRALWVQEPMRYATSFQIWHHGDDRLLIVFGHGGMTDTVSVIHCSDDTAFAQLPFKAIQVNRRLDRLALLSTTHVPFLTAIGEVVSIVGTVLPQDVMDSTFRKAWADGRVQGLGGSGTLDRERLISLRPDAVLAYPYGAQGNATLRDAGLRVVQVSEDLEEHPLGRAEWIRFFGGLTGHQREADSLFAGIMQRYEAQAALAAQDSVHPVVFFGSQWNGQWSVPPGNSYMARLIADAGGRYVFADRTASGNIDLDMETLVATVSKVDNWGMIAQVEGHAFPRHVTNNDPRLMQLDVVKDDHLFCGNTRTADLFGQALLEPDQVLRDLRYCIGDAWRWKPWEEDHRYFLPLRPEPVSIPYEPEGVPLDQ